MMNRFALLIAYQGTAYSGWQIQPNARTVEGEIEKALTRMNGGRAIDLVGASRTDAGVHAEGQLGAFSYDGRHTAWDWRRGLNAITDDDIAIRAVVPVADDFHPRFASRGKWYRYCVWFSRTVPPGLAQRVWAPRGRHQELDLAAMRESAATLCGEHDFTAFRASDCEARTTVRRIESIEIHRQSGLLAEIAEERGELVVIDVRGNAFLKNMVRILAGTLVDVGLGRATPAEVEAALESRDRRRAGQTAPAAGLTLVQVFLEPDVFRMPTTPGSEKENRDDTDAE